MNDEKKAMLAASAAYSIFGLSFLFSKMALEVTEPMILLFVRFSITVVVLNLLVLTRAVKIRLRGKKLLGPIAVGILQPVLYFIFENYGLKYTTTSFTGIIASVNPIFTAILGVVLLRERPTMKQWLCIGLSIVGVMMVSIGSTGGENTVVGCLCLFMAYLCGSLYSLLVRKLSGEYSPFEMTYIMFTVGFAFFAVTAFAQFGAQTPAMVVSALGEPSFLVAALYLGALTSVGAFFLVNYSLARLPLARASIFNCMSTVVSVLAGVLVMHDPFSWLTAAAFVLILVGVWGANAFAQKS